MGERSLHVVDLGRCEYDAAWALQKELHAAILEDAAEPDRLILVEHPPVITLGRRADPENVLFDEEHLSSQGVELRRVDRGGDVTYHGPGQVVAYPIVRLTGPRRDVHGYFRSLEQVVIELLAGYGIDAVRQDGLTGVWVGDEKVCAMGVAIKRWITYHGLALNVDPNLGHFRLITPCGIADKGVTSLRRLLGRPVPVGQVKEQLVQHFAAEFEYEEVERESAPERTET
ncbi:MAG: lipoyl(octanoyl) transferase LipB [Planctomycetota bacterium]